MNRSQTETDEVLKRSLPRASNEDAEAVCERVLNRLKSDVQSELPESRLDFTAFPQRAWKRMAAVAAVASVLIAAVWIGRVLDTPHVYAVLETTDSAVYRTVDGKDVPVHSGERIEARQVVHSIGANDSILALGDGSRVEMRSKSELLLEHAPDGIRIRLNRGDVIVSAANQGRGHLYVQTKDLTVSVIGTVFLVNAEGPGSRVAVIEGVVQAQLENAGTPKKLSPGEQVTTNPTMPKLPVVEEIAWSRHAPEHLALLQQALGKVPQQTPARLEFSAASIRAIPPNVLYPNKTLGIVCHGIDGQDRLTTDVFVDADPLIVVPPGRCIGQGVALQLLVAFAYQTLPRYVSGGPNWGQARSALISTPDGIYFKGVSKVFHIEAAADDPATVTKDQLRQMFQRMLASRFKLAFHRESQQSPGYALVVAKSGSKLKEVFDDEETPIPVFGTDNVQLILKGRSRLDTLVNSLNIGLPIINKTGLTRIYEYAIPIPRLIATSQRGGRGAPSPPSDRASEMSNVLEDRLGLRLQNEKSVRVNMIVIDGAEEPSPN
jgi:uncharacterized protein (TIGR03435 family)